MPSSSHIAAVSPQLWLDLGLIDGVVARNLLFDLVGKVVDDSTPDHLKRHKRVHKFKP